MQEKPIRPSRPVEQRALGRVVRETRARRGLSQMDLGDLAGKHHNYIGALERGQINPTLATILDVTDALDITLPELFTLWNLRLVEIVEAESCT